MLFFLSPSGLMRKVIPESANALPMVLSKISPDR